MVFRGIIDTNNDTVTLAIQNSQEGGIFKYASFIPAQTNENFDAIKKIRWR